MSDFATPTPNTAAAVIARLRGYADARGWTKSRFAGEAGLRDTVLRDFDKPDWNPTRATLERLEALIPEGWQPGDAAEDASAAAPAARAGDEPADGEAA